MFGQYVSFGNLVPPFPNKYINPSSFQSMVKSYGK